MPRVDVWDVAGKDDGNLSLSCGFPRGLEEKYELSRNLGEGGFGSVRIARRRETGTEFACKSICKRLDVPMLAVAKQQQHLDNIKREVRVLRKLRGALNVVALEEVFEDDTHVHIVMELCRGGELFHRIGKRHYSESTVASFMRAVLRTLTQCHSRRIMHRDIKPGNFMLLTDADDSPVKAIDFGLAVFFDPEKLPLTNLGLEGTPWFMAPEVLSSAVVPASDVWAAGVMAYQLLSGRFPFDDRANPDAPALSKVWKAILGEQPKFTGTAWADISPPAVDFCRQLLNKDPAARPSARDALEHPWLRGGTARARALGKPLHSVVQRLQRYGQQNVFKRTVLDMIANELLRRHVEMMEAEAGGSVRAGGGSVRAGDGGGGSVRGGGEGGEGAARGAAVLAGGSAHSGAGGSAHGGTHGGAGGRGSIRASTSALEALRRARERRSMADFAHIASREPSMNGGGDAAGAPLPLAPLRAASAGYALGGDDADEGEHHEQLLQHLRLHSTPQALVRATSLGGGEKEVDWEVEYMARRWRAMEGSAHGAQHMARWRRAAAAALAANGGARLEGTWHGPSASGGGGSGGGGAGGGVDGSGGGESGAGRSWHGGSTSPFAAGTLQGDGAAAEFLRFVEEARRQRQEQRKAARLALESSACVSSGLLEDPVGDDEDDQADGAPPGAAGSQAAAPGGGPRGVSSAAATAAQAGSGSGGGSGGGAARGAGGGHGAGHHGGLVKRLREGVSGIVRSISGKPQHPPGGRDASATSQGVGAEAMEVDEEMNALARSSLMPAEPAAAPSAAATAAATAQRQGERPGSSSGGGGSGQALPTGRRGGSSSAAGGAADATPFLELQLGALPQAEVAAGFEAGRRGQGAYAALLKGDAGDAPAAGAAHAATAAPQVEPATHAAQAAAAAAPLRPKTAPKHVGFVEPLASRPAAAPEPLAAAPLRPLTAPKHVGFAEPTRAPAVAATPPQPPARPQAPTALRPLSAPMHIGYAPPAPSPPAPPAVPNLHQALARADAAAAAAAGAAAPPSAAAAASGTSAGGSRRGARGALPPHVKAALDALQFNQHEVLTAQQLQQQLTALGYRLAPSEVADLASEIGISDAESGALLNKAQFAASQMDWGEFQLSHRDMWLECLRSTFEGLDADKDGRISNQELMKVLADKLPESEINAALEDVLLEAAADEDEGLDFAGFTALLSAANRGGGDSRDNLDQYDARLSAAALAGGSLRGGCDAAAAAHAAGHVLSVVPEN